jgi:ABC-type multidrug transport system ATPase subunit
MSRPKLLLLDEPSLGLAPIVVKQIFATLRELAKTGMTIFLVEQNANHALKLSDRAYVMVNGEIRMTGTGRSCWSTRRCVTPIWAGTELYAGAASAPSQWKTCRSLLPKHTHIPSQAFVSTGQLFSTDMWSRLWKTWWHIAQALEYQAL